MMPPTLPTLLDVPLAWHMVPSIHPFLAPGVASKMLDAPPERTGETPSPQPLDNVGDSTGGDALRGDTNLGVSVAVMQTQFASREELLTYITEFSLAHGFAVVTHRSNLPRGQLWLRCDLGGASSDTTGTTQTSKERKRKRKASQRQLNCPFQLYGRRVSDGTWLLKVQNGLHTHDLASQKQDLETHPTARRLSGAQKRLILDMTDRGLRPAVIMERLKERFPDKPIKVQDVYNARNYIRTERLAGRTPFGDEVDAIGLIASGSADQGQVVRSSVHGELQQHWSSVAEILPRWTPEKQNKFLEDVRRLFDEYQRSDETASPPTTSPDPSTHE